MGMDGLSMSNTGMLREATSRDYSAQTEEAIHKDENNKQVGQLQTQMRVKEDEQKNSDNKKNKKKDKQDDAIIYEKEETSNITDNTDEFYNLSDEDLENKTFYVKITKEGDIFELYDKESNRLVERISAKEVNDLVNKLNMASGILVNRSV